jgi:hypothetical protein
MVLDFAMGCRCQAADNSLHPGGVMLVGHPHVVSNASTVRLVIAASQDASVSEWERHDSDVRCAGRAPNAPRDRRCVATVALYEQVRCAPYIVVVDH